MRLELPELHANRTIVVQSLMLRALASAYDCYIVGAEEESYLGSDSPRAALCTYILDERKSNIFLG